MTGSRVVVHATSTKFIEMCPRKWKEYGQWSYTFWRAVRVQVTVNVTYNGHTLGIA